MSNTKKKKKSTKSNKKQVNTSKLIPIIAILEVLILVAVSTYAWYFFSANKTLSSGIITVNANSGLEIDFNEADKSTYIDIFDYVDQDKFAFEPATSVDGRNIYFPTSGTFGSTDTSTMVFRDGTANDINSKYLNIDFELTNTYNEAMEVYLSTNSFFKIKQGEDNVNGKALRLAFYNNDGNSGNVTSNLVSNIKKTSATVATEAPTEPALDDKGQSITYYEQFTVYFYNSSTAEGWSGWSNIKAYVWNSSTNAPLTGVSWPGGNMVKVSGNLYYYTFKNPYTRSSDNGPKTYTYDSIIFDNGNGGSGNQTVDMSNLTTSNGKMYIPSSKDGSGKWECNVQPLVMKTAYFLKPSGWVSPYCITSDSTISSINGRHAMTEVTTGIYSYTYPSTDTYIRFVDNSDTGRLSVSTAIPAAAATKDQLYYFPSGGNGALSTIEYSESSIYFYNTRGWKQPYAYVNAFPTASDYTYAIPMIALSGDLFFCRLPVAFLSDSASVPSASRENCKVYFKGENKKGVMENTNTVATRGEDVYRCLDELEAGETVCFKLDIEDYADATSINENSYAVISPGVSAGFQRAANPVNEINLQTGAVESVIPTFASSFDDYIMGSGNPVFIIGAGKTVDMSMIIWLEGTDSHCTGEHYAGNKISMYLEFATKLVHEDIKVGFTYRFVDETEQHWTCNTITNPETGITVSPVMQLYDVAEDRGYIMHSAGETTYNNEKKIRVWECTAPQELVNEPGHELQFRRVNPYDETEVWNRWEAGSPYEYREDAYDKRVVTYTAFADGSPDPTLYEDYITTYGMPSSSSGGLWGAYEPKTINVYDGRRNRFNINGDDGVGNTADDHAFNIGYTYTYPNSRKTVQVEYKSSPNSHFYSFIVPSTIVSQSSNVYFRLYSNVNNTYAINSDLNKNITVDSTWWAGSVQGMFYELNEEDNNAPDQNNHMERNTSTYHSYWGSDVLYIQGRSTLSVSYNSTSSNNECFMQAKFYNGTNTFYSYLYHDDNYKGDYGYGYVAVVPSEGREFTSYRIERCLYSNHSDITRDCEWNNSIASSVDADTGFTMNIIKEQSGTDGRILILDYDWLTIYFDASNWDSKWEHPGFKYTGGSTEWGGGTSHYNSSGRQLYRYMIRSGSTGNFYWENIDGGNKYSVNMTSIVNGYNYYPTGSGSATNINVGGSKNTKYWGNKDNHATNYDSYGFQTAIHTFHYSNDNSSWPEYTPPKVKE